MGIYFVIFDREFARTELKRAVLFFFSFYNKTSVSASDTLHFSFYPPDTSESESRAHRTLALHPTHQGPEYILYYEGIFLSI